MTVAQLLEALTQMPPDAVVPMEGDGGLSLVAMLELVQPQGGAPAEVLLLPSMAK
ncbi:hypothetical protein [uncultured Rhodoblastus sp.]|uniref:hypothetical protein n=1 Tax=uncultured Rhodoblastus sp. TaxID=543037 RepID=UPI0025F9F14B|nr:hypothetical protein [uncultured Rhodoblastus sp.]